MSYTLAGHYRVILFLEDYITEGSSSNWNVFSHKLPNGLSIYCESINKTDMK